MVAIKIPWQIAGHVSLIILTDGILNTEKTLRTTSGNFEMVEEACSRRLESGARTENIESRARKKRKQTGDLAGERCLSFQFLFIFSALYFLH